MIDDDDHSMVCSLADRDSDFDLTNQNKYRPHNRSHSRITMDSDEEPPAYNPKK